MDKIELFDNQIYKIEYDFKFDTIKEFCHQYHNDYLNNVYGRYGANFKPHKLDMFKGFYDYLEPIYKSIIIEKWGLPANHEYYIEDSWLRSSSYGEFKLPHDHGDVVAVICAYLNIPENSETIEVKNPSYNHYKFVPFQDESWSWKKVPVKENEVIIMPGWFIHRTQENKSYDIRFMIATNIGIKVKKKLL